MSVDDVLGVETWHMNQSQPDTEPGSAAKDMKSIMTNHKKKSNCCLEETNIFTFTQSHQCALFWFRVITDYIQFES